jgi:hypothetical protein
MAPMSDEESYFARVEEHFGQRRGGPLVLSPSDWQMLEAWHRRGIPLPVVLRGINQAFDRFRGSGPRPDRINSLRYCEQEVEAAWEEHRAARPGAAGDDAPADSGLPGAAAHLRAAAAACRAAGARDLPAVARAALEAVAGDLEELAAAAAAGGLDARSLDRRALDLQQRLAGELSRAGRPPLSLESLELPGFSPYEV